ncbi:MAG: hypothetical protein JF609_09265 [Verrucomicrobia bacterium]|nr:hypothetical protein [Verrucomicrobiota bacterium]
MTKPRQFVSGMVGITRDMRAKIFLVFLIFGVALIAWQLSSGNKSSPLPDGLQERFVGSSSFEALSLNPVLISESGEEATNADVVLGYRVLGTVKIDDRNMRRELVSAVGKDIADANHPPSSCILQPRHGIRCGDGSNAVVMLICYHCGEVLLDENGKSESYLIKTAGNLQSPASMKLFEKIFKEAGIKTDAK